MQRLIFGCGYLGSRVGALWKARGDEVTVVTRSSERAVSFTAIGYRAIVADVTQPSSLRNLPNADTLLYAVGHDRSVGPAIHEVFAGGLRNVLDAKSPEVNRVIYISTTGVYGDAGGDWVDEATPPAPTREGGRASLAAEGVLRAHPLAERAVILRLAGIYGPGRVPFLEQLRSGEPIPAVETGYLNLIHVDDAARIVDRAATVALSNLPRVYCVSDGCPLIRGEYYREVARRINAPPPKFVVPPADSPRALRAGSDRRVKNDRMLRELGINVQFPSCRAGLSAILA
jgi:nucleoside-diphosphate-sugar epimerase